MKFTDTFINSFNDGFVRLYVGTIPTNDYEVYQKMEDVISIDDVEFYFEFLNELSENEHKKISLQIWRYIYILKVVNPYLDKNNQDTLKNRGTQNKQNKIRDSIKKDLNSAKNFKMLIDKIFTVADPTHKGKKIHKIGYKNNKVNLYGYNKSGDLLNRNEIKDYNINDLFEIVDLIIDDLETKEFNFISNKKYNLEKKHTTKEDFKEYLINICKTHKIKYSDSINQLLENLF